MSQSDLSQPRGLPEDEILLAPRTRFTMSKPRTLSTHTRDVRSQEMPQDNGVLTPEIFQASGYTPSFLRTKASRRCSARCKRRLLICCGFTAAILLALFGSFVTVAITSNQWPPHWLDIFFAIQPPSSATESPSYDISAHTSPATLSSSPTTKAISVPSASDHGLHKTASNIVADSFLYRNAASTAEVDSLSPSSTTCRQSTVAYSVSLSDLQPPSVETTGSSGYQCAATTHDDAHLIVSATPAAAASATASADASTATTKVAHATSERTISPTLDPTSNRDELSTIAATSFSTSQPTSTLPTNASNMWTSAATSSSSFWTTEHAPNTTAVRSRKWTSVKYTSPPPGVTTTGQPVSTFATTSASASPAAQPESYVVGYQPSADTIPGVPKGLTTLAAIEEWFKKLPASKLWGEMYLPIITSSIADCASVGRDAMLEGGTAVDGAIASQICHGFFNPLSAGVGGGSFMVVLDENRNMDVVFNAREAAPRRVSPAESAVAHGELREGGLAIAVPGEVAGFYRAWKQFGKLPWPRLFARTIYWCEQGHNISKEHADSIRANADVLSRNPVLREDYVVKGTLLGEGQMLYRRRLGHTLRRIAQDPMSFYRGSLARDILRDAQDEGAPWTDSDLSDYRALTSPALRFRLPNMGLTMLAAPPPSFGAIVGHILSILDGFGFHSKSWDPYNFEADTMPVRGDPRVVHDRAATTVHRVVEAIKFGLGLRVNIGDPRFNPDTKQLLEIIERAQWVRSLINPGRTMNFNDYFMTGPRGSPRPQRQNEPVDQGDVQTLAVDLDGLVVSLTSSVGRRFGSKRVGRKTGIVFNNAMADFSTAASPLYSKRLNAIAPQARPASTMVPTILVDEGFRAKATLGANGGSRGISYMIWAVLYRFAFNAPFDDLKFRPPMLHPWPVVDRIERRHFTNEIVVKELLSRGHRFIEWTPANGEGQALTMIKRTEASWLAYPDRVPTNGLMTYSGVA